MPENFSFELKTSGSLHLKAPTPTLLSVEEFCAEARRLGLGDQARLNTGREGLMGPVTSWYFTVPVAPKIEG